MTENSTYSRRTTHFRQNDTRTGTWLSVDPEADKFPSVSPYVLYGGNPIINSDKFGGSPENSNMNFGVFAGIKATGNSFNLYGAIGLQLGQPSVGKTDIFSGYFSGSYYRGNQLGTAGNSRTARGFDVSVGADYTRSGGIGTPMKFNTLNENSPSPFPNGSKYSFTFGQMLTYNGALNAKGDGSGVQSMGIIGIRLDDLMISSNNDTKYYGTILTYWATGGPTDAGWTGGMTAEAVDKGGQHYYWAHQCFTGNPSKYANESRRPWGSGYYTQTNYHLSLNKATNSFGIGTFSMTKETNNWFQMFIHKELTDNRNFNFSFNSGWQGNNTTEESNDNE